MFSFMVEYIKSKQDETITKDLIRSRQLDQSMLRFTRIYQSANTYERDESSVEYSHVMSEGKEFFLKKTINLFLYIFSLW